MPSLASAESVLHHALQRAPFAAQVQIRQRGEVRLSRPYGWLDPDTRQQPTQSNTLFDLASVTKLFAAAAFMTLVEEGRVALDQPACDVLPEFDGPRSIAPYEDPLNPGAFVTVEEEGVVEAGRVTFRHLLAHNSGLPAWRPLFQQSDARAALETALNTPFACSPGARVVYSDIGLILLGLVLERLTGLRLDEVVRRRVTEPLGLSHTSYRPLLPSPLQGEGPGVRVNIAPTEFCRWRNRRIVGEVHDENAWRLGGGSAHAGLFSIASDVARFGQVFLDGGYPLLKPDTVAEMTRLQAEDGATRWGLGFALWSPDPAASGHPFGPRAFGHTGFTGTSLWIDPERALVVALLTNEVYHGRGGRGIGTLRVAFHRAVLESLESNA